MDECIKNVVYTHTHNGILFGHKKITFAEKWRELKNIIFSKINKIQKDK